MSYDYSLKVGSIPSKKIARLATQDSIPSDRKLRSIAVRKR